MTVTLLQPFKLRTLVAALICAVQLAPAQAGLLDDYRTARTNDAAFAAALGDYQSGQMQARIAGAAYYPEAKFSQTQLASEDSDRQTLTITQPILSADRWLSLQEVEPRKALAEAALVKSQYELAQRLFKVVTTLAEAREKLVLSRANIEALQVQAESARKLHELGMGTITDLYDAQVRLAQARAQTMSLQSVQQAAERQYEAIVGQKARADGYALVKQPGGLKLPPLDELLDQARRISPIIRSSELASEVGEISSKRAKAVFLPTVVASMQNSKRGSTNTNSSGITVRMDIPIDTGSVLKSASAAIELQKLKDKERDARLQVELEVRKLYSEVQSSLVELAIRVDAIQAAQQSFNANEQSFKGGVRSKIDVLNALQVMHQTQVDYVTALMQLGDRLLNLQVQSAVDIEQALQQVQAQLFLQ